MKKTVAGILCLILILPFICSLTHSDAFYVNDNAGVLTESQEKNILASAKDLAGKTKAQIVVLTVKSLDGKPIEEYALDIARDWGIGDKDEDNGVLILLSTGDREVRVEVGLGLEGCLPDAKTGRLLDTYAIPYYQKNDFANGTEQLYYAILNEVRVEYGLERIEVPTANAANKDAQEPLPDDSMTSGEMLFMLIAVVGFIVLVVLTKGRILFWIGLGGRGGRGGSGGGRSFGGGGGFGGGGAGRKF